MDEATLGIVIVAMVVRTCIVGGFLFVLPRITRKGLLFGVYVGEEAADGDAASRLRRQWQLACAIATPAAFVAGLGVVVAGWPLTGGVTPAALLLVFGAVAYLRFHARTRPLAPRGIARAGALATASLDEEAPSGERLARFALLACLVVSAAVVAHAAVHYPELPARVPRYFGFAPQGWATKSFGTVMVPSALNLLFSPFFALLALMVAGAKRSLRGGTGGGSAPAQAAFRAANANLLSAMALLLCANLSVFSIQFIRHALGTGPPWGWALIALPLVTVLVMAVGLLRLLLRFGQGGSRLEQGSVEAPLTNGLADDCHWLWGIFYVNREDPSLMVEQRFGLGYTMNYGNVKAVVLVVLVPLLAIGLIVAAVSGAAA